MPATPDGPIAIYYEHPDWFRPLFAELDRREIPYERIDATAHSYDPAETESPYSLVFKRRRDGFGQEYLYVWDRTGGDSGPGIKTFLHDRIQGLEILAERYEPRYPVELSKAGEFGSKSYFGQPFGAAGGQRRRRARVRHFGSRLVYVVECSYCHRRFTRTRLRTRLRHERQSMVGAEHAAGQRGLPRRQLRGGRRHEAAAHSALARAPRIVAQYGAG